MFKEKFGFCRRCVLGYYYRSLQQINFHSNLLIKEVAMLKKCWFEEGEIVMMEEAFLLRKMLTGVEERSTLFILMYVMAKKSVAIKDNN